MPEKVAIAPASSLATSRDDLVERERLLGQDERAARDRRDQRDDVALGELVVARGVLAVDRVEQSLRLVAEIERRPDVGDVRDAVDLALRPAGTLAETGEQPHRHTHGE